MQKKKKIDVVLVCKIDRLTRSPKDFYQLIEFFEQSKIDFISITERFDTSTPAGRLLRNIMLTFAQFERELASERTKDKMLERAKKGMCNGGLTPYGYVRKDKKLVPHPKESEIIKSIFDEYLETRSHSAVYDHLKKEGIKNKNGKNFCKTNVAHILRNEVYVGKVKHNGVLYKGQHEPLVSKEIFSIAQKIHQNKVKKFRVCKNFMFAGLITCVECGSKMTTCFTNKWKDGKMRRYRYYRCTSTMKHDWQACSVKQMSAERLENFCVESLDRIAHDTNYIENMVYRLNNDPEMGLNSPQGVGFELERNWSKLSTADVAATLNFFLSEFKSSTGVAQNLLAKQCFQKIAYSPKSIEISVFCRPRAVTTSVVKPQTPLMAGSCEKFLTTSSQPVVWLPSLDEFRTVDWKNLIKELVSL